MHVLTRSEPARTPLRTTFDVVAMQMPIVYNEVRDNTDPARRWMGHHDHDGLIYTLAEHREALEALRERIEAKDPDAARPHPLVRPLVLRAGKGERVEVRLTNLIRGRHVGMPLTGGRYDATSDGAHVSAATARAWRPTASRSSTAGNARRRASSASPTSATRAATSGPRTPTACSAR